MLAITKKKTVSELVSKALSDNKILTVSLILYFASLKVS